MNAYDFSINYFAGLLLLRGADPYSNPLYRYPFPFTYFWALMALPGEQAMPLMCWTMERHIKPGWRGAVLGALLTMKPQSGLILLPWHLVDWLKHDRPSLVKWFVCTGALWGVPLLWRADWISTWLVGRGGDANFCLLRQCHDRDF